MVTGLLVGVYSNMTDSSTSGSTNQYSAKAGGGSATGLNWN